MIKPRSHAPFAPVPTGLVGAIRLPPFQVSSFILLNSSRRSTVDPRLTALKLPLRTAGQRLIEIGHVFPACFEVAVVTLVLPFVHLAAKRDHTLQ